MNRKKICWGLAVLALVLILAEASYVAFSQPTPIVINRLSSFAELRGAVIEIQGGPFEDVRVQGGSKVKFDNREVFSYALTETSLIFIVPVDADCGENGIYVEGPANIPGQGTQIVKSNTVVFSVRCPTATGAAQYAPPKISRVTPSSGLGSSDIITIEGDNFIPPTGDDPPFTAVEFRTRDLEGERGYHRKYGYPDFFNLGTMKMELIEEGQLPCGIYEMQLTNFHRGSSEGVVGNWYEITISEDCRDTQSPTESPASIEISDLSFSPDELEAGEQFRVNYKVTNVGSAPTGPYEIVIRANEIEIIRIERDPLPAGENISGSSFRNIQIPPGLYTIYVETLGESESAPGNLTVSGGTAPPPVIGGNLGDYDKDNNCKLSDGEFFDLIDAWIGESIQNLLFFSGVDAWIGQTDICAAAASRSSISLRTTPYGVLISTIGSDEIGSVSIFDANGREVFRNRSSSSQLIWNLLDSEGKQLANGVYFVKFGNMDEIRKFVVLR